MKYLIRPWTRQILIINSTFYSVSVRQNQVQNYTSVSKVGKGRAMARENDTNVYFDSLLPQQTEH